MSTLGFGQDNCDSFKVAINKALETQTHDEVANELSIIFASMFQRSIEYTNHDIELMRQGLLIIEPKLHTRFINRYYNEKRH